MRKLNKKSGNRLFGEGGRYAHTQFKKGQKAILITCLLLFITFPVFSQHNFVLYNNGQLPQASFENPGQEVWMNGYLILPGIIRRTIRSFQRWTRDQTNGAEQ
jgi:hypothetical protein